MARVDQLWWVTAGAFAILFLVTLCVSALDQRLIDGAVVWAKPIKFQMSLAIHFATLAAIVTLLSESQRSSSILFWIAAVSIGSAVFEITYIMIQAARQEASHFNLSTPFYQAMYVLMAIGAVFIVVAAAIVGAIAWFDPGASMGPATRIAIAVGLIGGTLLTLLIAFRMGGALNYYVGTEPADELRFPLTGWSQSVGDLRVPHFFATHMIQAVPLAGIAADWTLPPWLAVAVWFSSRMDSANALSVPASPRRHCVSSFLVSGRCPRGVRSDRNAIGSRDSSGAMSDLLP